MNRDLLALIESRCVVPADIEECWPWTAGTTGPGYPSLVDPRTGRATGAHRIACEVLHGPPPPALPGRRSPPALHSCDTKVCVNPLHLSWGTPKRNAEEAVARGLQPRGVRVGSSRLSDEQVLEIRRRSKEGESYRSLAPEFGVSWVTIGRAVRGENWTHV